MERGREITKRENTGIEREGRERWRGVERVAERDEERGINYLISTMSYPRFTTTSSPR